MAVATREQGLALGALALSVLACALVTAWSLQVRSTASQELSDRQDVLARVEAAARSRTGGPGGQARVDTAPATAFLDAATSGLAGAALEAHVARLAGQHATLVSFASEPPANGDAADSVRIEASLDINLRALQVLLYDLESGTPYVFVDSMTLRPAAGSTAGSQEPLLRVTLGLHCIVAPECNVIDFPPRARAAAPRHGIVTPVLSGRHVPHSIVS